MSSGADRAANSYPRLFALFKTENGSDKLDRRIRAIVDGAVGKLPDDKHKEIAASNAAVQSQIQMMKSPWLRYFITYDRRPVLRKV